MICIGGKLSMIENTRLVEIFLIAMMSISILFLIGPVTRYCEYYSFMRNLELYVTSIEFFHQSTNCLVTAKLNLSNPSNFDHALIENIKLCLQYVGEPYEVRLPGGRWIGRPHSYLKTNWVIAANSYLKMDECYIKSRSSKELKVNFYIRGETYYNLKNYLNKTQQDIRELTWKIIAEIKCKAPPYSPSYLTTFYLRYELTYNQ